MFYNVVHILSITVSASTILMVYATVQITKENKNTWKKNQPKDLKQFVLGISV